jgi:predicted nuclease of predicted toxin-antitoxin system
MSAPLRFVIDEQMRGRLLHAVQNHNTKSKFPIDATQVGDPQDLPRGTSDPDILLWAERNDRIVVTWDQSTMTVAFLAHLAAGRHSPGVVILRSTTLPAAVTALETIAYASLPGEWFDRIDYFP